MIVIEGLDDGPVNKGEMCRLTLYGEGGVIQHFEDKAVIVGKWKALEPHGRLIDADAFKDYITNALEGFEGNPNFAFAKKVTEDFCLDIDEAPTVLEASNKTETPRKARICPHYQGGCGLDKDIFCYCSCCYEMCDKYKEASE